MPNLPITQSNQTRFFLFGCCIRVVQIHCFLLRTGRNEVKRSVWKDVEGVICAVKRSRLVQLQGINIDMTHTLPIPLKRSRGTPNLGPLWYPTHGLRKTPGQENQAGIFTIMMFLSSLRLFVVNGRNNRFELLGVVVF